MPYVDVELSLLHGEDDHLPSSQAQSWKTPVQRIQKEVQVPPDPKAAPAHKSEGKMTKKEKRN